MQRVMGLVGLLLATSLAGAQDFTNARKYPRSQEVLREFQRQEPCPSTGKTTGSCPGYVRDHIWPLCAGGEDAVYNLQWQTREESLKKDKLELQLCRELRQKERKWAKG